MLSAVLKLNGESGMGQYKLSMRYLSVSGIVDEENTEDWKTTSTMSSTAVQTFLKITHEVGRWYLGERDQKIQNNYSLVSRLVRWKSSQVPHALFFKCNSR